MKFNELIECPFCGYDEYYTKEYVCGTVPYAERFDGEEAHNEQMYDGLLMKHYSGRCYCRNCNRYLGNKVTNIVSRFIEKAFGESEDTE